MTGASDRRADKYDAHSRAVFEEFILSLMISILICAVVSAPLIVVIMKKASFFYAGFLPVATGLVFYAGRLKRNIYLFFAVHLAAAGLLIVISYAAGGSDAAIPITAAVVIEVLFSWRRYDKRERYRLRTAYAIMAAAAFFAVSTAAYAFAKISIDSQMSVVLIIYMACHLIYYNLVNIDEALSGPGKSAPAKNVVSFNNKTTTLLIAGVTVVIVAAKFLFIDRLLLFIYNMLATFVTWIAGLIKSISAPAGLKLDVPLGVPLEDLNVNVGASSVARDSSQSGVHVLADTVAMIVAAVFFVAFIAALGILIYRKVKNFVRRPGKSGEDLVFFAPGVEDPSLASSSKRPRAFLFGASNAERVRRLFYVKVKKYIGREDMRLAKSDTSGGMKRKISVSEDIGALAALYDKARYSDVEISRDELIEVRRK